MEALLHLPTEACASASVPAWRDSILALIFFAFTNAGTSYLLHFTFREGQILHPYRRWLERKFRFANGAWAFWYKPLGGCIVCMNVWLALLSFWFVHLYIGFEPQGLFLACWWIAYVVTGNFFLRKMLE